MDDEVTHDEEFKQQAISVLMDLGLPEDEAEMQVEDYVDGY